MYRASNAERSDVDGTGLGLYTIKNIVVLLGGTIGFKANKTVGTTFTVKLPVKTRKTK